MTHSDDVIGVIRQHRWVSATIQERQLAPRVRVVVALGRAGETRVQVVTREELMGLVRPGTTIAFLHCFLLADPRKRRVRGGMKDDFHAMVERLEKRGGVLLDVDTGLSTADPGHRRALLALADDQIARSNRGLKSALNGALSKGRPRAQFTEAQLAKVEAIWFNRFKYPTWGDVARALPKGFTTARAHKTWGPRGGKQ